MIKVKTRGSFKNIEKFFKKVGGGQDSSLFDNLDHLALLGVQSLAWHTPIETGVSADSWGYILEKRGNRVSIRWTNSNTVDGTPVVIWLQYGHGTGTGGYVEGRDFINPAMEPIFSYIADEVWREVSSA